MSDAEPDPLRDELQRCVGKPLSDSGPAVSPDEVNVPMIRHWVDALDDRNPAYLEAASHPIIQDALEGVMGPNIEILTNPNPNHIRNQSYSNPS